MTCRRYQPGKLLSCGLWTFCALLNGIVISACASSVAQGGNWVAEHPESVNKAIDGDEQVLEELVLKGELHNLSPDAPPSVVAVVHGLSETRLIVMDLRSGNSILLPSTHYPPEAPIWSPNGDDILFAAGNQLMIYQGPSGTLRMLDTDLATAGWHRYEFDGAGQLLAVGRSSELSLLSTDHYQPVGVFPFPAGMVFADVQWTRNAEQVVVLLCIARASYWQ